MSEQWTLVMYWRLWMRLRYKIREQAYFVPVKNFQSVLFVYFPMTNNQKCSSLNNRNLLSQTWDQIAIACAVHPVSHNDAVWGPHSNPRPRFSLTCSVSRIHLLLITGLKSCFLATWSALSSCRLFSGSSHAETSMFKARNRRIPTELWNLFTSERTCSFSGLQWFT